MSPLQKLTVVNVCHHVTLHGKVLRSIIIVISKIFIKLSVSKSILVHRKDILKKTKSVAIVNFYCDGDSLHKFYQRYTKEYTNSWTGKHIMNGCDTEENNMTCM